MYTLVMRLQIWLSVISFVGFRSFKEAPLEEDWQTRKFQNKVLKPTTTATLLPKETPY